MSWWVLAFADAGVTSMSDRRLLVLAASIALIAIGLLALQFPVYLDDFDHRGMQVRCGNGFGAEPHHATIADQQADSSDPDGPGFVEGCQTALAIRRGWAISTAVLGLSIMGWIMLLWLRHKPSQDDDLNSPN